MELRRKEAQAYLTDTAFPLHFCCETERPIGWVLDLPNAAGNLILTQPCVDIPNFVSKLEQLLQSKVSYHRLMAVVIHRCRIQQNGMHTSYVMLSTSRRQSW